MKEVKKNGICREFNKHGTLISEGMYVDGLQQGMWKEYYDSGELAIIQHYDKGTPHGKFTSFHLNGNTWSEGSHSMGRCDGTFRVYDEEGSLIRIMVYKGGKLVEDRNVFDENPVMVRRPVSKINGIASSGPLSRT